MAEEAEEAELKAIEEAAAERAFAHHHALLRKRDWNRAVGQRRRKKLSRRQAETRRYVPTRRSS